MGVSVTSAIWSVEASAWDDKKMYIPRGWCTSRFDAGNQSRISEVVLLNESESMRKG